MFKVFFLDKSLRELNKLDSAIKERVKEKLKKLEDFPELGKPLKYSNFWSLRVGGYRVIYEIDKNGKRIIILTVKHRKNVYENFEKIFLIFF
ncbi:hypothetical protein A3K63_02305 [Candidatus Micrarchaeota archaeon RBG_16_49_10]|nr:MAG: hypothetical protein A3K63_02305 [Candidatus Micrarchaeota archaeon RBG_16_49_10]